MLINERGKEVQMIEQSGVDRCVREIELLQACSKGCEFIVDFIDAVNVYPKYFKIVMELAEPLRTLFYYSTIKETELKVILYC